jgi:hypothetical protein
MGPVKYVCVMKLCSMGPCKNEVMFGWVNLCS